MLPVRVTVTMGKKVVALEDVKDARVSGPLRQAAQQVGSALAKVKCPEHGKPPTDIRLHFDAGGNGDLKYESCCPELGKAVARVV